VASASPGVAAISANSGDESGVENGWSDFCNAFSFQFDNGAGGAEFLRR
jgi:hypothetical protein